MNLLCLHILAAISHRFDLGWLGQTLPPGLKRAATQGEYIHEKTGQTFVYVEAGTIEPPPAGVFTFGQEPPHPQPVNVKAFYIAKYQVTVADFRRFVEATQYKTDAESAGFAVRIGFPPQNKSGASWKKHDFEQADDHPAVAVSWNDAIAYCHWAASRLPDNNEFLRAAYFDKARNGFPPAVFYDVFGQPDFPKAYVNYSDDYLKEVVQMTSSLPWHTDGFVYTAPVTAFPKGKSAFGVMDLGNVGEWSNDKATPTQLNPTEGYHVNGGSYQLSAIHLDLFRVEKPNVGILDVGFRIVISGVGS